MSHLAEIHAAGGEVGGQMDAAWARLVQAHGLRRVVRAVTEERERVRIGPLQAAAALGDMARPACPPEAKRTPMEMLTIIRSAGAEGISPDECRKALGVSQGQYYHLYSQVRHLVEGSGTNQTRRLRALEEATV
jgi:hypothetical protein